MGQVEDQRVLARRVFLWRVPHGGYQTGETIIMNIFTMPESEKNLLTSHEEMILKECIGTVLVNLGHLTGEN